MQLPINRKWAIAFGALLGFPAAYFIMISILKYAFNISYLFDASQPFLERLGIKEALGFNINLLILLGPLTALLINLFAVLTIGWQNDKDRFSIQFSIQKHWWNIMLVILSGILLAVLFVYALGENCRC